MYKVFGKKKFEDTKGVIRSRNSKKGKTLVKRKTTTNILNFQMAKPIFFCRQKKKKKNKQYIYISYCETNTT